VPEGIALAASYSSSAGTDAYDHRFGSFLGGEKLMLLTIAVIILILWLLGAFALHIGGGLIHILLIVGLIVLVVHFVRGRGAV
jgi:hypothetical protein